VESESGTNIDVDDENSSFRPSDESVGGEKAFEEGSEVADRDEFPNLELNPLGIVHLLRNANVNAMDRQLEEAQEADLTLDYLQDLIAAFQTPLYLLHDSWHLPMLQTVTTCWHLACGNDSHRALINFAGFLILPGLLSVMQI
jgi:hypothetical protein